MMEVTIYWSSLYGDSNEAYLVDIPFESSTPVFDQGAHRRAIDMALDKFYEKSSREDRTAPGRAIRRIDIRPCPTTVLKA